MMIWLKKLLMIFKNKALNYSIITVIISVTLQFLFIRFASYYIDKEIYGNFVLLLTLVAGLSTLLLQLPSQAFDRFYNEEKDKNEFINQFRTYLIFLNIISLILIIIYGYTIEKYSNTTLFFIFILFMFINIYSLNQKVFLLNLDRKKYMILKISEACAKFTIPIFSYIYFNNLISLVLGMIVGYFASSIILYIFMKEVPFSLKFKYSNLKKYFFYSYPFIIMSLLTWGISFSDRYFIEYFLTTSDVAIYALLAMVAGIGQVIGQIYFMYAEPKILKFHSIDQNLAYKTIKKYMYSLLLIFIFLFIIVMFLPKNIFSILLEKEIIYNDYYYITFLILVFSIFLNILHIAHHLYLKLLKKANILGLIYLIAFIMNIIGNLFIETYGIIAAAISTLIAYIVILILQIIYVAKYKKMESIND